MANKGNLWQKFRADLVKAGADEDDIDYARRQVRKINVKYIPDYQGSSSRTSPADKNVEILNLEEPIDDEELDSLLGQTGDAVPIIAKRPLTDLQIEKLSGPTKEEYFEERAKLKSQRKAMINNSDALDEQKREFAGVKTKLEKDRKFAKLPEKSLWGDGDTYYLERALSERLGVASDYIADKARQTYVFKMEPKLDKQTGKLVQGMWHDHINKMLTLAIHATDLLIETYAKVQDEKNRDTLLGWMQKGVDKFWNYGNHGAGEVDFIETGEYIMKLTDDPYVIWRIPIKTPFTREQLGDRTTIELSDLQNQLQITCPECKLQFNKPIVPDERRDVFAGAAFNEAVKVLIGNKASQVIENTVDNVLIVEYKSAEEFWKQELPKRGLKYVDMDPKKLKVIEQKPIKVKEENIDPDSKVAIAYNILFSRAGRKFEKSEYFSENA